ncbi:dTMP kinase [Acetobacteraceae bacterium ESL0709]|nr:dTMP kinase [Acetobacteraceae bacterium ESL0697]MDF7678270.1 dTMP kinase [Acetobacteraceae bacterium ESL0709]
MLLHPKELERGFLITFEGNEGVGKSTQSRLLAEKLGQEGYDVVLTREPGGTKGAEELRNILLFGEAEFSSCSEILLHMAARLDHVEKMIKPALAEGKVVICDRFHDSTIAYQVYGACFRDAKAMELVTFLRHFIHCEADLTFWLDMELKAAFQRVQTRGGKTDQYEGQGQVFHERVRTGFAELARTEPGRMIRIDASSSEKDVQEQIYRKVKVLLSHKMA